MDLYGLGGRTTSVTALILALVHGADSILCRYRDGFNTALEDCPEMCCDGYDNDREHACCVRDMSPSIYVGVTVGTMFLVSVILMCCLYLYCRHSILRTARDARTRNANNTRIRPSVRSTTRSHRRQQSAPSVSVIVMEPTLPPAYDSLPPPYYLPKESNPGSEEPTLKDGSLDLPNYPPPEYTASPPETK